MFIVRLFKITYRLKVPNSVSMYIDQLTYYYRVREQSVCKMLVVREFKITYRLKEPNSVSMYIDQLTY